MSGGFGGVGQSQVTGSHQEEGRTWKVRRRGSRVRSRVRSLGRACVEGVGGVRRDTRHNMGYV